MEKIEIQKISDIDDELSRIASSRADKLEGLLRALHIIEVDTTKIELGKSQSSE